MRQLNVRMLFVCFAALLFVVCADTACADTSKKEAEEAAPAPVQTAEAAVEEVTLTVTGMT
jgi:hypothetical protein